jgi:hypothetical protein
LLDGFPSHKAMKVSHTIIPIFHYPKASQETAEPLLFSPAKPVD